MIGVVVVFGNGSERMVAVYESIETNFISVFFLLIKREIKYFI